MADSRQKPISIRKRDRDILDSYKERYEEATGESTDWGAFLRTVALLGIAAVGIYGLARAERRSPQSVDVFCEVCNTNFLMAVPEGTGRAIYTTCPECDTEMVVDLGNEL